jgi:hypothetical protein
MLSRGIDGLEVSAEPDHKETKAGDQQTQEDGILGERLTGSAPEPAASGSHDSPQGKGGARITRGQPMRQRLDLSYLVVKKESELVRVGEFRSDGCPIRPWLCYPVHCRAGAWVGWGFQQAAQLARNFRKKRKGSAARPPGLMADD